MRLKNTKIKGLKIMQGKNFFDSRGFFREIFIKKKIKVHKPIFWCMSKSKKNVLRGLHIQKVKNQAKYVSVIKGKIFDVAVDLRRKSKTFGKVFTIILSDKNSKSVFIPKGFAHGFLSLEKENYVVYANSNYRSKGNEIGILWNDKDLKIKWPTKRPLVSNKDQNNLTFNELFKKKLKK